MPVYVDESVRAGRYLLCAVVVESRGSDATRRALRRLRKPGQLRIHMKHEGDSRRRQILSAITRMSVSAHVYECQLSGRSARAARDDCLRALTADLLRGRQVLVVIESCDMDHDDNQVIREVVLKDMGERNLTYRHGSPVTEVLLWLPDVVAWAYGRGGDWRRRVEAIVVARKRLGA